MRISDWSSDVCSSDLYDFGAFDLSYSVRYIGKQTIGTWEAQNAYKDICPESGTIYGGGTCTPGNLATFPAANADQYPRIYYPSAFYHNFRATLQIDNNFDFYIGIDNPFDKQPPMRLLGPTSGDPHDLFSLVFSPGH